MHKFWKAVGFAALLMAVLPTVAMARSGDMFEDTYIDSSNRPRVPSDSERRQDVLPEPPPIMNQNYDIFDSARPSYISQDADLMQHRNQHVDYGRDDMFVDKPNGAPHYPMMHNQK